MSSLPVQKTFVNLSHNQNMVNPWTDKIAILSIRKNLRPGNVKAFVAIIIEPFKLYGLKIVQQSGQRAYVAWPQTDSGGTPYPVLSCTDDRLKKAVSEAILDAWQQGGAA